jgi:hypothetical protein
MPLALTSAQLLQIMSTAKTLRRFMRDPFLQAVAELLQDQEIGDGSVYAACAKARNIVEAQNWIKKASATVLDGTASAK